MYSFLILAIASITPNSSAIASAMMVAKAGSLGRSDGRRSKRAKAARRSADCSPSDVSSVRREALVFQLICKAISGDNPMKVGQDWS